MSDISVWWCVDLIVRRNHYEELLGLVRPAARVGREVAACCVFRCHHAGFRKVIFAALTPLRHMPAMKSGAATHLGVVSTVLADFRAVEITHGSGPPVLRLASSLGNHRSRCRGFPIVVLLPCIQRQCMAFRPTLSSAASSSPLASGMPCSAFSGGLHFLVIFVHLCGQTCI